MPAHASAEQLDDCRSELERRLIALTQSVEARGGGMSEPAARRSGSRRPARRRARAVAAASAQLAYLGYDARRRPRRAAGAAGAAVADRGAATAPAPASASAACRRPRCGCAAPPIWLHCASVGEARSAAPLVARLRERVPRRPLVVSTTTLTGRAVARADLGADVATLLPVDALRIVDRVFRRVRPRAVILVETELWPGLLRAAAAVGAPVALVSGRLSARALARYRWAGPLFPAALAHVAAFGMQTAADAERIIALGAPPDRVRVTGSLKAQRRAGAAAAAARRPRRAPRRDRRQHAARRGRRSSCRPSPRCSRVYRDALLILAPRRPERFDEVAQLVGAAGLPLAAPFGARRDAVGADVPRACCSTRSASWCASFRRALAVFVGGTRGAARRPQRPRAGDVRQAGRLRAAHRERRRGGGGAVRCGRRGGRAHAGRAGRVLGRLLARPRAQPTPPARAPAPAVGGAERLRSSAPGRCSRRCSECERR